MRIVIFAAHPDDAEMCVGGSIARYVDAGHNVHVVNATNGDGPRVACAAAACEVLGCTHEFMPFEDQAGDGSFALGEARLGVCFDEAHLSAVLAKLREHEPDMVWTHWPVDAHPDHAALGTSVLRAVDVLCYYEDDPLKLWFFAAAPGYQTLSFQPNHYEDITAHLDRKRRALEAYEPTVDIFSVYAIHRTADKHAGYASGYAYAEAFVQCALRDRAQRDRIIGEGHDIHAPTPAPASDPVPKQARDSQRRRVSRLPIGAEQSMRPRCA